MPGVYQKNGLRFAYPENWTLDDSTTEGADASVTVTSPATAFWSVMRYHGHHDLAELAGCVADTLREEYPQSECEPADDDRDSPYPDPQGAFGYDLSFSYVDLMNTATIRAFHHEDDTLLVLAQAEDHEIGQVEPIFRAMTTSLVAK